MLLGFFKGPTPLVPLFCHEARSNVITSNGKRALNLVIYNSRLQFFIICITFEETFKFFFFFFSKNISFFIYHPFQYSKNNPSLLK
jgi:hypothetical protein